MVHAHKPEVGNCTFTAYTTVVYIQCVWIFKDFKGMIRLLVEGQSNHM